MTAAPDGAAFIEIDGEPWATVRDSCLIAGLSRGTLASYADSGWIRRHKIGATVLYAVADLLKGKRPRDRKPSTAAANLHRRAVLIEEMRRWLEAGELRRPLTPTPQAPGAPRRMHDGSWQGARPSSQIGAITATGAAGSGPYAAVELEQATGAVLTPEGTHRTGAIVPHLHRLAPADDDSLLNEIKDM